MGSYIPTTAAEREEMLRVIGVSSVDELFANVPEDMHIRGYLDLPSGQSEMEVRDALFNCAEKNKVSRSA